MKLGVGGVITYPRANKTRRAIANIPLNQLLLETDAPDMPLHGFQGEHSSPLRLNDVANCLAQLKGIGVEQVICQTDSNAARLFSFTDIS